MLLPTLLASAESGPARLLLGPVDFAMPPLDGECLATLDLIVDREGSVEHTGIAGRNRAEGCMKNDGSYVRWFGEEGSDDVALVGGKNASLGEMTRALQAEEVRVPPGFAVTAEAYREYVRENDLGDALRARVDELDLSTKGSLARVGRSLRRLFMRGKLPEGVSAGVRRAYRQLGDHLESADPAVAVRSSPAAEDLPEASFAGQQETFLNVTGEDDLLVACRRCYASLFSDRALAYREEHRLSHVDVALSIGVQQMVRADRSGSGVMLSLDAETGFPDVVVINASWGLGRSVVQGAVTPDEHVVYKPLLTKAGARPIIARTLGAKEKKTVYARGRRGKTRSVDTTARERRTYVLEDDDVLRLARWAVAVERHYGSPMEMEWARDGANGELALVEARPAAVSSERRAEPLRSYTLRERGERLVRGLGVGRAIAAGRARLVSSPGDADVEEGEILVAEATGPDWVTLMRRARAVVTDRGGRTSHAALLCRELGVPAVVGAKDATDVLEDGQEITVSCAEGGEGFVYEGALAFDVQEKDLEEVPRTRTRLMLNLSNPAGAFRWWRLPADGVGLARMEFVIGNAIKIHPMALVRYDEIRDRDVKRRIRDLTRGYDDRTDYFVDQLALGLARIAASQYPEPVLVRMSDFKTNEYASLIGGRQFEPEEANPMLGLRGVSRYYSERYRDAFTLECRALRQVREEIGLDNVRVMIPFCRTVEEADRVLQILGDNGLRRGENALEVHVMCEIPSNVILAREFARRFDGFSIGTNDLTQLVLGIDRDSPDLQALFDPGNEAILRLVRALIDDAHAEGVTVSLCGQAPSEHPELADFLVEAGIDSISLSPDSVLEVRERVAEAESAARAAAQAPAGSLPAPG